MSNFLSDTSELLICFFLHQPTSFVAVSTFFNPLVHSNHFDLRHSFLGKEAYFLKSLISRKIIILEQNRQNRTRLLSCQVLLRFSKTNVSRHLVARFKKFLAFRIRIQLPFLLAMLLISQLPWSRSWDVSCLFWFSIPYPLIVPITKAICYFIWIYPYLNQPGYGRTVEC